MPTRQQDKEFMDLMSDTCWLDRAIEWIADNLKPQDVFSEDQLKERAFENIPPNDE